MEKWFSLAFSIFTIATIVYMVQRGKRGIVAWLRELPAVTAIPEGVKRATEMGRPVFYAPGTQAVTQGTYGGGAMAGLTILRYVSKLCAEQRTRLVACVCHAVNVPYAQESIKLGCIESGHPEEEARQEIYYHGDKQNLLSYAAMMQREKAGASFVFGSSGATTMHAISAAAYQGIFQIVGDTEVYNSCWLPPLCDYWLAIDGPQCAAAYVSGDPETTNTILGGDIIKLSIVLLFIIALVLTNLGVNVDEFLLG